MSQIFECFTVLNTAWFLQGSLKKNQCTTGPLGGVPLRALLRQESDATLASAPTPVLAAPAFRPASNLPAGWASWTPTTLSLIFCSCIESVDGHCTWFIPSLYQDLLVPAINLSSVLCVRRCPWGVTFISQLCVSQCSLAIWMWMWKAERQKAM